MGWNGDDESKHRPFFHHNRILQLGACPPARSSATPLVDSSVARADDMRSALVPRPRTEQAARSAILPDGRGGGFPGVEVSEWGSMLLGQHVHQLCVAPVLSPLSPRLCTA